MKNSLNIKFTNAHILSVMLIALASISYQVMLLRRKNSKNKEYKEVLFIYPED